LGHREGRARYVFVAHRDNSAAAWVPARDFKGVMKLLTSVHQAFEHVGRVTWMLRDTAGEMGEHVGRRRFPFRLAHFFEQSDRAGVGSVPLVSLVSCFLGLTMALLSGYQLHPYGQERLVPMMVGIGFTRELGPLITGIMVASRVGAAFTAELGTMRVGDEIEAIEAMGLGPLRFLVSPRLAALLLTMPCLVVVSNLTALAGGALASRWAFDISLQVFIRDVLDSLLFRDLVSGTLKSLLFGLLIGLVACYKGIAVRGGAAGVGDATTSSVVTAITTVIGFDTLFNIVLVALFPA
jgi:phospholipid/cholesterol/gamma-HCH transport system permease protein